MAGNGKSQDERQPASKRIRAFVAIELPETVRNALGSLQKNLRDYGFSAKWSRPENIHLTLKFLGDIAESEIAPLGEQMASIARETAPITIVAQGLGVFPSVRRPRVLWTGIGGETDRLSNLQQAIESGFETLGYERESKRFAGHFTLARFKGGVDPEAIVSAMGRFGGFVSDSFTADHVHLFQSELTPRGPIYTKIVSKYLEK